MALPSPSYTITMRVEVPASQRATSTLVTAAAEAGAAVTGVDIAHSTTTRLTVDVTCDTIDAGHGDRVVAALNALDGVRVLKVSDSTFLMHLGGKIEVTTKVPLKTRRDLSRAYTPGVARVCQAIAEKPEDARRLTIKRNTVAVVTDGTAVLGLGNIGPGAALPVMEGKAALFKEFAGVDAWPVCLDTTDTEEIIAIVKALAPVYGGVNLEDISAPRCFEIEERLRAELDIPVFHDDQHGTAIVVLAALINALKVTGKDLADVRIVVSGVGAAGSAIIKLLKAQGARHIVGFGRHGALHRGETSGDPHRDWIAEHTNEEGFTGTLKEGLAGADVFIGVSAGDILTGADVATMADGAIVFALANPTPEVDPVAAGETAAIVATGRSDYPNQINNVLAFPGLFRGLLDAAASVITDEMLRVAAVAIAEVVSPEELNPAFIIPGVFDTRVAEAVAEAVKAEGLKEGRHDPEASAAAAGASAGSDAPGGDRTTPGSPSVAGAGAGAQGAGTRADGARAGSGAAAGSGAPATAR
ncbi:NAD-dependent malic enzyme [Georgenia sp. TF02-10]|uniref:NAD-dependent malic enzyme n=1 Tax=Georgenia sp. TF02-10 TaxID=2917725 RepID=UPI001FA6B18A|nr:NAD-dependent malic enzyme [Georgenia sp. TF02-10]UNX54892.1 NAD-dependent malic enzyme [Georgenia sp. TF02-10]